MMQQKRSRPSGRASTAFIWRLLTRSQCACSEGIAVGAAMDAGIEPVVLSPRMQKETHRTCQWRHCNERPTISEHCSEVEELGTAITAARLIAAYLETKQLASLEDVAQAPKLIAAILNLVEQRMNLLVRIARGNVDPCELVA
ncbi:MAG: hypothetical protein GY811_17935 [Myxococcales bacterium]|nr:hypothetical protein [Myxococcales bacterium]